MPVATMKKGINYLIAVSNNSIINNSLFIQKTKYKLQMKQKP